jgi:hypothetical protein
MFYVTPLHALGLEQPEAPNLRRASGKLRPKFPILRRGGPLPPKPSPTAFNLGPASGEIPGAIHLLAL